MATIKFLGSLWIAILLVATLGLILIVSTTLESWYGTPFVQRFFYQAGWFDLFLGFLGVNILCSALSRWPFQKKHTGFLITHAGILMLLIGSLQSRLWGVDGQMMLFEGQSKDTILENRHELFVHAAEGHAAAYDLVFPNKKPARRLAVINGDTELALHRAWDNAVLEKKVIEGEPDSPPNRAVRLSLTSETMGAREALWLIEKDPTDADSAHRHLGPAVIELKEKEASAAKEVSETSQAPTPAGPTLRVSRKSSKEALAVNLLDIPKGELSVPDGGFRVVGLRYHPDARVGDKGLTSISEEPRNPAVEFDVYDAEGKHRHFVKFALYPDFESMHGKNEENTFDISADLVVSSLPSARAGASPSLVIYNGGGGWSYHSKSSQASKEGKLSAGETHATGWMDFSFRVEELLTRAVVTKEARQASPEEKGELAAEVSLTRNGKVLAKDWVTEDGAVRFPLSKGELILMLRTKERPVPFRLSLKDFRKVDYAGTNRAASFESDVRLEDPSAHLTIEKTISMNKPLDHKGYRIFQSSYIQNPMSGEASVFTVAKNPGIGLIYGGSCVLFAGIFLTFFVPSLSSIKH